MVSNATGDYSAAQALGAEALSRAQSHDDQFFVGMAYFTLGEAAFNQDDVEAAQPLFEKEAALLRALGAKNFLGGPILRLGQVALRRGDYTQTDKYIRESF